MDAHGLRRCGKCGVTKPVGDFAKKRADAYQTYCRLCQSAYHKEHYRKNKQTYLDAVKRRRLRLAAILRTAKERPCADCGIQYPYYVMDLDHREGEEKIGNVSQAIHRGHLGKKNLLAEIDKCDVVCANCHRERTNQRKQWARRRARRI